MYYGYYRESAKYKSEWYCIASEVAEKLRRKLKIDRWSGRYGSRTKIVKH